MLVGENMCRLTFLCLCVLSNVTFTSHWQLNNQMSFCQESYSVLLVIFFYSFLIFRMKFLVKKWRRATRVGVSVYASNVHSTNGASSSYIPPSNGFSNTSQQRSPPSHNHPATAASHHLVSSSSSSTLHHPLASHVSSNIYSHVV